MNELKFKKYELVPNLQRNSCDIIVRGTDPIEIYNDLGCLPFTAAPALCDLLNEQDKEINSLTDKLNETAFDLYKDGVVSFGKAVEISSLSYREFMMYCNERGFGPELNQ